MAEQQQLDLPPPPPRGPVATPRRSFAGLTRGQLMVGGLMVAALIWGIWVTRAITVPRQDRIVSARLSTLVGEYVNAEARSASPPAQVQAEMRAFMTGLAGELQRRSARGEVVLVGEAVLTKNVPDITDELKRAMFASGVPAPRQASAAELQQMQLGAAGATAALAAPGMPAPAGTMPGVPVGAAAATPPAAQVMRGATEFAAPSPFAAPEPATGAAAPAAGVATFRGSDGSGGR